VRVVKTTVIRLLVVGRAGLTLSLLALAPSLHAQSSNIFDQIGAKVKQAGDAVSAAKGAMQTNNAAGKAPAARSGQLNNTAAGAGSADVVSATSPVEVNGFVFGLERCENVPGSGVTCHFRATNTRADRALGVAPGASYIIDGNGNQYRTMGVQLGTGAAQTMTVANVPVEGQILFQGVNPGVGKLATVHMFVTGGQFDWRNVPLVTPQVDAAPPPPKAAMMPAAQSDSGASSDRPASSGGANGGNKSPRLTNEDVIKLTKAGLAEATVVQMIDTSTPAFDTSANGLIAMKTAGVSDTVIQHVLTKQSANN
jgi:hypothetical protein